MVTIKKIRARSAARLLGGMYLILGALFGILYIALAIVPTLLFESEFITPELLIPLGVLLLYGCIGWIGGYIGAWMYNFTATHFGGIELEIEESHTAPTLDT